MFDCLPELETDDGQWQVSADAKQRGVLGQAVPASDPTLEGSGQTGRRHQETVEKIPYRTDCRQGQEILDTQRERIDSQGN